MSTMLGLSFEHKGAETVKLLLYIESLFKSMMVYTVSRKHGMPMTHRVLHSRNVETCTVFEIFYKY